MRDAATEGIAILFPDTSPRGAGIEDEAATWDFGIGKSSDRAKGLESTLMRRCPNRRRILPQRYQIQVGKPLQYAGSRHKGIASGYRGCRNSYRMSVLLLITSNTHSSCRQDFSRQSIFGHSMGGHGALTIYLNSLISGTKQYRSCSAFSPICEPSAVPWGQKAFRGYLAGGVEEGKANYDASILVGRVKGAINVLIDYVRIFFYARIAWCTSAGEHIDMLTVLLPGNCGYLPLSTSSRSIPQSRTRCRSR